MKLMITFDTDNFTNDVQQDGQIDSSRDARMLLALINQTFTPLVQQLEELHKHNKSREAAMEQSRNMEVPPAPEAEEAKAS